MPENRLRRILTWTILAIYLATVGGALLMVYLGDGRQWYIESAGIDLTLDMAFTSAGRWLATAVLGALALLGLLALAAEVTAARRHEIAARFEPLADADQPVAVTYAPTPSTPSHPAEDDSAERKVEGPAAPTGRPGYTGLVLGDEVTQRMERSVSSRPEAPGSVRSDQGGRAGGIPPTERVQRPRPDHRKDGEARSSLDDEPGTVDHASVPPQIGRRG